MSQIFTSDGQSIGASASVLLVNIQHWFPLGLTDWFSLLSKELSTVFSSTTVQYYESYSPCPESLIWQTLVVPKQWSMNLIKSWLIGKDSDPEKDRGQEEKWAAEDEMAGWYQWLNGHEFKQSMGDSERQESLACCNSWGHKELDMI